MGRADIAIYSTISGGIRLCLHPRALCVGSAYDDQDVTRPHDCCRGTSERPASCGGPGHLIGRMLCAPQSLRGHTDCRPSNLWTKNHDQLSPACAIAGRLVLVAPVHPPSSRTANAAGRCRFISEPTPFLVPSNRRSALMERTLRLSPMAASLAAELASSVDFPRRCPLPGILPCSLPRVGVRRYKPILQSCYHDFAPNPCGSRYQTAGSIGALARDEPVNAGSNSDSLKVAKCLVG